MIGMLEAVQGCMREEVRMDVIANNLANASVIGFKRDRIAFQNMLMGTDTGSTDSTSGTTGGTDSTSGTTDTSGTEADLSLIQIQTDFSDGPERGTGDTLDVAINGKGFFKIQTPEGVRYTRKGNFSTDAQGYLTTQDGNSVLGKSGPINVSGKDILIDRSGKVLVDGSEVGQLDLVDVSNPESLVKEGNGLFSLGEGNEEASLPAESVVRQGYVEGSNVDVPRAMVAMIHSLRAFESYQKAIQVIDGLNNTATSQVSQVG
jgi:flagellar basal-body rod protein FlgF